MAALSGLPCCHPDAAVLANVDHAGFHSGSAHHVEIVSGVDLNAGRGNADGIQLAERSRVAAVLLSKLDLAVIEPAQVPLDPFVRILDEWIDARAGKSP